MEHFGRTVPVYMVLPFVLMLACIAILPLAAAHFWEHNRNKGIVTALLAVPTAIYLWAAHREGLLHSATEYVSFLALLGSLYVIAGGIHVTGDLKATPRNNVIMLALGALLANLVGTTGASMLLIRVLLNTNSERKNVAHLPFFFILIVSNCAGLLTPLGDPPLFLGYLRGVPFTWTFTLLPYWLTAIGYLLLAVLLGRRARLPRRARARPGARSGADRARALERRRQRRACWAWSSPASFCLRPFASWPWSGWQSPARC